MTYSFKEGVGMTPPLTTTLDEPRCPTCGGTIGQMGKEHVMAGLRTAARDRYVGPHRHTLKDCEEQVRLAQPAPPTEALRLLKRCVEWHSWFPDTPPPPATYPFDEARRYLAATEEMP